MWQETDQGLYKLFKFQDFAEAFSFMQQVAAVAERLQHHPRWTNEWNRVEIWLQTHDEGGTITAKDHELAQHIDQLITTDKAKHENN